VRTWISYRISSCASRSEVDRQLSLDQARDAIDAVLEVRDHA